MWSCKIILVTCWPLIFRAFNGLFEGPCSPGRENSKNVKIRALDSILRDPRAFFRKVMPEVRPDFRVLENSLAGSPFEEVQSRFWHFWNQRTLIYKSQPFCPLKMAFLDDSWPFHQHYHNKAPSGFLGELGQLSHCRWVEDAKAIKMSPKRPMRA